MVEGGKACRKLVNPIVGECDKCKIPFCMTHRLYEDHQCRELPTVSSFSMSFAAVRKPLRRIHLANLHVSQTKMELYQANAAQLLKEQTQVVKI